MPTRKQSWGQANSTKVVKHPWDIIFGRYTFSSRSPWAQMQHRQESPSISVDWSAHFWYWVPELACWEDRGPLARGLAKVVVQPEPPVYIELDLS